MYTENTIEIKRPYVTKNGSLHRLNADIYEAGKPCCLFVEVEEQYAQYFCTDLSDAFLYLILPVALRKGYDIYCEAPVTEQFLHNINEILIPHLVRGDKRLHSIAVYAPTVNIFPKMQGGVGTAISCGVDSMYTIMEYTNKKYANMQLTHFVIVPSSIDLRVEKTDNLYTWEAKYQKQFVRYEAAAKLFNLPLVKMYSNFFLYIKESKVRHLHIHHYLTMAHILAIKKLWRIYYFSSTVDFTQFNLTDNSINDTDKHELLSMHVLSTPDFSCFSGGAKLNRIEKTLALTDYYPAQKYLHPCFNEEAINCSQPTCSKCLRALLTLDYYDKLDSMREVFHVDLYRRNRPDYLYALVKKRENEFLKDLYEMFLEKYPDEMHAAIQRYEKDTAPIAREKFNALNKAYKTALSMCSMGDLQRRISEFIKSQGISTVYCTGSSSLGKIFLSMLPNEVKCFNIETSTPSECDASIILQTDVNIISASKKKLLNRGATKIFDLYEIENHLREEK